jgi:hypothetical protein
MMTHDGTRMFRLFLETIKNFQSEKLLPLIEISLVWYGPKSVNNKSIFHFRKI